jgi:large subunit ribosomal protein L4
MSQVKVKLYNDKAEEVGEEKLSSDIFGIEANPELVHQVVVAQNHNSRQVLAHTKGRAEVRGGGKKPWKQKGTGRARAGSSRSPIWIGGGVTFGPTKDRNFSVKINKKMKKKALFMCLSDRVTEDSLILMDKFEIDEVKTKKVVKVLDKLNKKIISEKEEKNAKTPSILVVLDKDADKIVKAAKNIEKVSVIGAESLNVVDILKYKYLLTTVQAVKSIEKVYGNK